MSYLIRLYTGEKNGTLKNYTMKKVWFQKRMPTGTKWRIINKKFHHMQLDDGDDNFFYQDDNDNTCTGQKYPDLIGPKAQT